jgi:hypothetical protein
MVPQDPFSGSQFAVSSFSTIRGDDNPLPNLSLSELLSHLGAHLCP